MWVFFRCYGWRTMIFTEAQNSSGFMSGALHWIATSNFLVQTPPDVFLIRCKDHLANNVSVAGVGLNLLLEAANVVCWTFSFCVIDHAPTHCRFLFQGSHSRPQCTFSRLIHFRFQAGRRVRMADATAIAFEAALIQLPENSMTFRTSENGWLADALTGIGHFFVLSNFPVIFVLSFSS